MGHGRCETFSKQTPLAGPDRRPTRDPKLIGDHAYKLLRSFGFDPTELRGISIQIQKLELGTAGQPPAGQARLPFKRTEALPKPATTSSSSFTEPTIPPQAPPELVAAIEHPVIDLPSFSQVDMDVYNSLPDELRGELKAAYQQRDEARAAAAMAVERSRPATPEPVAGPSRLGPPRSPVKVGHIIQQLAPKRSAVSPSKSGLFTKDYNLSALGVSEAELRKLDIDVDVFAALPREFQREQLSVARHIKAGGKLDQQGARKVLKAVVKRARGGSPGNVFVPPPPPKAMFPDPPRLPQTVRDEEGKKQKVFLSSADEVQAVMERWGASFTANAPYDKDVNFFADFLLKSVDSGPGRGTDAGIETAVKIMQWWRLLLRRHWAAFEQEPVSAHAESVGAAWWRAFRDVKAKMDVIARKRFGGSLSLR
jgi:DNA repair protein REV1